MIDDKDLELFRGSIAGAKKIKQDKVQFKKDISSAKNFSCEQIKQQQSEFYFSDEYVPDINTNGTVKYVRIGADKYLAKQLRRGDFPPELILDLHGLNKDTAKKELAALIHACKKQHVYCACVVHGIGEGILKHKVPHYLVQHPDIIAIHQAPLEYGGKGAVLFLVDLPESDEFRR